MQTLIKDVHVLTMDSSFTRFLSGFILIEDNLIKQIGPMTDLPDCPRATVVDGHGAIAMPGMVNTHTHIGMIPFRSLGDDTADRLTRFLFPLEMACMTEELAYASGKYAIAEMQLAGITTFFDMYYFEDKLAQATDEMKARAILAETVLENSCDSPLPYGGLAYAESFIPKWLNHSLITPAIAPHAPYTNTKESLQAAATLAEHYDVPLSIHLSEMSFEMQQFQEDYQKTPVAVLADWGILSERLIAAHCIFTSPEDIALMAKHNLSVAHCIGANTKSAKGIAPISEMQAAGITVGLGTDGPSSGNTLDLFSQMRLVANCHKTALNDRTAFPAQEIVKMATIDGARALGLADQIGSLELGKKADIVLVETTSANMFPIFDPYAALVYSAQAANVSDVFVNGAHLVANKTLTHVDLNQLRASLDCEMSDFKRQALDQFHR